MSYIFENKLHQVYNLIDMVILTGRILRTSRKEMERELVPNWTYNVRLDLFHVGLSYLGLKSFTFQYVESAYFHNICKFLLLLMYPFQKRNNKYGAVSQLKLFVTNLSLKEKSTAQYIFCKYMVNIFLLFLWLYASLTGSTAINVKTECDIA